jgi:hypothetical protein
MGITIFSITLMIISGIMIAFTLLGVLIAVTKSGPSIVLALPITIFYLFLLAVPGILGWGLWNLENSARIGYFVVFAICAAIGFFLALRTGLLSPFGIVYVPCILGGGGFCIYLNLPSVKSAFEGEINVISFKDL